MIWYPPPPLFFSAALIYLQFILNFQLHILILWLYRSHFTCVTAHSLLGFGEVSPIVKQAFAFVAPFPLPLNPLCSDWPSLIHRRSELPVAVSLVHCTFTGEVLSQQLLLCTSRKSEDVDGCCICHRPTEPSDPLVLLVGNDSEPEPWKKHTSRQRSSAPAPPPLTVQ